MLSDTDRLIHESGHWARFNGSSLGILLTFMRRTRDLAAARLLQSLDRTQHARLADLRQSGTPLFATGRFAAADHVDPQIAYLATSWFDLYHAYRMMLGSPSNSITDVPNPVAALDSAVFSTWYQSAGRGMLPFEPGVAVEGPASIIVFDGIQLTTRHLLENAAVCDEFYPNSIGALKGVRDATWTRRLGKQWDAGYGLPHRLASTIAGRHLDPSTTLTLIDFALNPQVPGLTHGAQTVAFDDLYPPARFVRAAHAIATTGALTEAQHPTSHVITETHNHIAGETGMAMGRVDAVLTRATSLSAVAHAKSSLVELIPEMQLMHARRLLEERAESVMTLSHFGLNFVAEGALRFVRPDRWWTGGNWWLFPPLEVVDDAYHWPADRIGIDEATTLLCATAVSGALDDILLGAGPLRTDHLPTRELRDIATRELLGDYVRTLTGFSLAWDV